MESELRTEVNSKGQTIARMKQINGTRKEALKALNISNDSLHFALAKLIKEGGRRTNSATIINTTTEIIKEVPVNVTEWDTVYVINSTVDSIRDSVVVMPIYKFSYSDEWQSVSVTAKPDTGIVRATYHNKLNMRFERRRKFTEVYVVDENPNASVSSVTSWSIDRKPKRWGLGVHLGYGVTEQLKPSLHVGVSLSYQFIQF